MARIARVVIPDVPHHVTQRCNRRQPVFFNDDDRRAYLALVAEACAANATLCLAWCLMRNSRDSGIPGTVYVIHLVGQLAPSPSGCI